MENQCVMHVRSWAYKNNKLAVKPSLQLKLKLKLKPTKAIVGQKTMQTSLVIMTAWQITSTTDSCVCTRN